MSENVFEGYLLVTDVDGTLLDSSKQITAENREAIERFVSLGGRFTLATGRIAGPAEFFVRQLPVNAPAILYNGAVIYDFTRGEAIVEQTVPVEAHAVLDRVREQFPEIGIEIYVQGEAVPYVLHDNETTTRHRAIEGFPLRPAAGREAVPASWLKVLLGWEPARLDEASPDIVRLSGEAGVTWVRSDNKYFEMLAAGATKGHALEQLLDITGIPRERCIAMGDHLNDLELLRRAGVGVAVANAHPELLGVCDYTGKHHNEHAVADVVQWLESEIRQGRR